MKLRVFDLTLDPISPLHVGSGEVLQRDVDFWIDESAGQPARATVLDSEKALLSMTDEEIVACRDGRLAAHLGERRRAQCASYHMPIYRPRTGGDIGQLRALQRDAEGHPFIAGSSLKGAIRTALLLALMPDPGAHPRAPQLEEAAFAFDIGRDGVGFANRDLNRALRCSDLHAEASPRCAVLQVGAHSVRPQRADERGGDTIPVWCETVLARSVFRGTLTIEAETSWWGRLSVRQREVLSELTVALREWARTIAAFERNAWGGRMSESVAKFYGNVERFLDRGTTLAVLGWGTGWQAKTIGPRLTRQQISAIADDTGQRRWRSRTFPDLFPATRKLAWTPDGLLPIGWVRLTLKERRD